MLIIRREQYGGVHRSRDTKSDERETAAVFTHRRGSEPSSSSWAALSLWICVRERTLNCCILRRPSCNSLLLLLCSRRSTKTVQRGDRRDPPPSSPQSSRREEYRASINSCAPSPKFHDVIEARTCPGTCGLAVAAVTRPASGRASVLTGGRPDEAAMRQRKASHKLRRPPDFEEQATRQLLVFGWRRRRGAREEDGQTQLRIASRLLSITKAL